MKSHIPEEVVTEPRRIDVLTAEDSTVAAAVREVGNTEVTYYRWCRKYADLGKPEALRLRELEKENARLKKLVADLSLDNDILGEVLRLSRSRGESSEPGAQAGGRRPRPARARCERTARLPRRRATAIHPPLHARAYCAGPGARRSDARAGQSEPRYGYRRAWVVLRGEGRAVNRKRVHRLWREAGLQVPQKTQKRRRLGSGENSTVRLVPLHPNPIWCYDFVFDATEDGRPLKLLPVLDEYTRECLALVVGRSLTSHHVVSALDRLIQERGAPTFVRSDSGSEFIAHRVAAHLLAAESTTKHVDSGSPWQNGYSESVNGKLRDELLSQELFGSLTEARVLAERFRRHYNEARPHSALGYLSPAAFAATLTLNPAPALS